MATETITLKLVAQDLMSGNVSKAIGSLDKLAKQGGLVGAMAQGVGQSFGQMLNPIGLVTNAIGNVTNYMGDALRAARDETAAISKLTTAIRENDDAWDGNIDKIEAVIAARQRDFAFSDGDQREALARLVSVTKDYNKALDLERQAMDLARLKSISLVDASEILGKVYGGNVGILSRYGIQLRRGASSAEALAEIQKRAAGQAEAYGKTSAGAAERLDQSLGDLSETIGHLIEGPAADLAGFLNSLVTSLMPDHNTAFQTATDYVNNYGKAVEDVIKTGEDLDAQLKAQEIARYADEWRQWLDVNSDFGSIVGDNGKALEWLRKINVDFARSSGFTIETLAALAAKISLTGGSFSDLVIAMQKLQAQGIDVEAMAMRYVRSMDTIDTATTDTGVVIRRLGQTVTRVPEAFSTAVVDMKARIKDGKAGIIEQFRDLAWQTKHPFAEKNYAEWLGEKYDKAGRKMRQAAKNGRPAIVAQYRALRRDIQIEMALLPQNLTRLQGRINSILGNVYGSVTRAVTNLFNLGNNDGGFNVPQNAVGTRSWRGGLTVVGEKGPEIVNLPTGSQVIPNGPSMAMMGGGASSTATYNINVHIAPGGDMVEAGRQMVQAIRAYERRSGAVWRSR